MNVRALKNHEEFAEAVRLQKIIWDFSDLELLPVRFFVVASRIGGQTFGAFDGSRLAGFLLAIPGIKKNGRQYLHSHMLGVSNDYRNAGVGQTLKLAQREDALTRGIQLIEWSFDPFDAKNAYFNLERLGAIVRNYVSNMYGITASSLHGGLPTDRCIAEWWIAEEAPVKAPVAARVSLPQEKTRESQDAFGRELQQHFAAGLAMVGFDRAGSGTFFIIAMALQVDRIVLREIAMPLVHFFETSFSRTTHRRIILVEAIGQGVSGWGEVTCGEHPFYNEEWTDAAWMIVRDYVVPRVLHVPFESAAEVAEKSGQIRGHFMARGGVEAAFWDLEARMNGVPLWEQIGGGWFKDLACGVSIGIQDSVPQLLKTIEKELAAGYQRIKLKIKPGWDVDVIREVRRTFPAIRLMADANSAYTLEDADHLKRLDEFRLMMIEQPLAHDEIVDHAALQAQLDTPICLDECIRTVHHAEQAIRLQACGILNIKLGRVGGFGNAVRIHDLAQAHSIPVWCGGMLESGVGRAHNIALSTLPNFVLPGDVSASQRYWERDIISPPVEVSPQGTISVSNQPGFGYGLDHDYLRRVTVREETLA